MKHARLEAGPWLLVAFTVAAVDFVTNSSDSLWVYNSTVLLAARLRVSAVSRQSSTLAVAAAVTATAAAVFCSYSPLIQRSTATAAAITTTTTITTTPPPLTTATTSRSRLPELVLHNKQLNHRQQQRLLRRGIQSSLCLNAPRWQSARKQRVQGAATIAFTATAGDQCC